MFEPDIWSCHSNGRHSSNYVNHLKNGTHEFSCYLWNFGHLISVFEIILIPNDWCMAEQVLLILPQGTKKHAHTHTNTLKRNIRRHPTQIYTKTWTENRWNTGHPSNTVCHSTTIEISPKWLQQGTPPPIRWREAVLPDEQFRYIRSYFICVFLFYGCLSHFCSLLNRRTYKD